MTMSTRVIGGVAIVAASIGFWAGSGFSDEKMPSEAEMWMKLAQIHAPGPHQKNFAKFAGEFDVEQTMYSSMGEMKAQAKSKAKMILGGRILKMKYEGNIMGKPFEGYGFLAYDNFKKKVQMVWMDGMTSGITVSEGDFSEEGKVVTLRGSWDSPWGSFPTRQVMTAHDDGTYTFESFSKKGDKEHKEMSLKYTKTAAGESKGMR